MTATAAIRERVARLAWHADPARPSRPYQLLRQSQWWDRERLERLQLDRLRTVLAAAAAVPFHRERLEAAGVRPGELRSIADLRRVPELVREDVQRLGVARLSVPSARGQLRRTSGATGQPLVTLGSRSASAWFQANDRRFNEWLGVSLGERRISLPNRPASMTTRSMAAAAALNITVVPGASLADPAVVRNLAASLAGRPAALVTGVATGVFVLARSARELGLELPIRACWSGGGRLLPHHRDTIEAVLGRPVFERYRNVENGAIAYQCPEERSFHVAAETVLVELVRDDGEPAAPGELGHVLVTDLRNLAMPLVRYRLGDRAIAPERHDCRCGRGLPVLGQLTGRERDVLVRADGTLVPPDPVAWIITRKCESVLDFRVVQREDLASAYSSCSATTLRQSSTGG
ncbi:MAG: hypothetical protein U0R69_13605 [Gaiellales bacterium]